MRGFLNQFGSQLIPFLLRSPLHFLVSGRVMLITFVGRKSGSVYTTPVEYCRDNERIVFFIKRERVWWKNLRGGAPVTVRIAGRDLNGQAQVITDADVIQAAFAQMHSHLKPNPADTVMVLIRLEKVTARYASAAS